MRPTRLLASISHHDNQDADVPATQLRPVPSTSVGHLRRRPFSMIWQQCWALFRVLDGLVSCWSALCLVKQTTTGHPSSSKLPRLTKTLVRSRRLLRLMTTTFAPPCNACLPFFYYFWVPKGSLCPDTVRGAIVRFAFVNHVSPLISAAVSTPSAYPRQIIIDRGKTGSTSPAPARRRLSLFLPFPSLWWMDDGRETKLLDKGGPSWYTRQSHHSCPGERAGGRASARYSETMPRRRSFSGQDEGSRPTRAR